jgi:CubicO group peptidase (beta-lactamase class C family)
MRPIDGAGSIMTSRTRITALLAFLTFALRLPAQEQPDADATQLSAQIAAYLEAHHAQRQWSGTALVAEDGKVVYRAAFGLANADWNIPNELDTKFRVGAITKQFTAMLVLLLVQEGKLELDVPIGRYLPQLPTESGDRVTIHHLLTHTSGIPSSQNRPGWQRDVLRHHTVAEFVADYCSGPLEFEPGTAFSHANSGYFLVGAIVEAVTGQTYATALRQRVLDPLQMNDTGYDDESAVLEKRAIGYEDLLGQRRVAPFTDMSNHFASDGLYSTVGDLWKWEQALRSKSLLDGMLVQRMFTPGMGDYGYGWHIDHHGTWHGSFNVVPADGVVPGFEALIGRLPSRGRCLILLSNSRYSFLTDAAEGVEAILEGKTPEAPTPPPAWSLAQTVLDRGIEAGLTRLLELPLSMRETPRLPPGIVESTIELLGYRLLKQHRVDDAVRLFEFNTRAFPESARRWASLGDAHLQAGNRKLAIESLRKASLLEPWNTAAKTRLAEIEELAGK